MRYRKAAILCAILYVMVLFNLSGCDETAGEKTVSFYYRISADTVYEAGSVIQCEVREVDTLDLGTLLELYLEGPVSDDLVSPFPRGTALEWIRQAGGTVEIVLSESFYQLTGINKTLAEACLTMTLTDLEDVDEVIIYADGEYSDDATVFTADRYVFEDTGIDEQEENIKIYFADSASRYLMGDQRSVVFSENESAAIYIIQQLIAGPDDEQLQSTIPEGTELLSIVEENGLCVVDFSAEFRENAPKTEQGERMTVYSIVNSLTELDEIDRVQILCEGQNIGIYRYLDLSEPYVRNEDIIGPVLSGLNEFDATIYMQSWSEDYLAEVPLRIQQTANQSQEELVLQALLTYEPVNGLSNPIPAGTELISEETSDGICYVTLSREFISNQDTVSEQRLRIISVVASLTALDNVDAVKLSVEGIEDDLIVGYDISRPVSRSEDWFFP